MIIFGGIGWTLLILFLLFLELAKSGFFFTGKDMKPELRIMDKEVYYEKTRDYEYASSYEQYVKCITENYEKELLEYNSRNGIE